MIASKSLRSRTQFGAEELENGAIMSQSEFHEAYLKTPPEIRAELIGGIVYMASPVSIRHGEMHSIVVGILFPYQLATKGIQIVDNTSVILGERDEPQPDVSIRILPEYGGQSETTTKDYIGGAPELIFEVAHSSRSIDLNAKKERYESTGVLEYLVIDLDNELVHWFDLKAGINRSVPADGIISLKTMPGLWINSQALFQKDGVALMATLNQGIATPEHSAFVQKLAAAKAAAAADR